MNIYCKFQPEFNKSLCLKSWNFVSIFCRKSYLNILRFLNFVEFFFFANILCLIWKFKTELCRKVCVNILRNFFVENLWADSLNSKYINSFWIDVIWIKVITKPQQRFCSILQGLVFFYFGCFLFKNLSIFVKAWYLISKTKQSRKTLAVTKTKH